MMAEASFPQVLVVDDSGFSRNSIARELDALGIDGEHIHHAPSGADAVQKIQSQTFHLFILDIVMPEIDGITLLKKVKASQPDAKVIMCSGNSSDEIVKEAINLGADGFIVKPIISAAFQCEVRRCLHGTCGGLVAKCHRCDSAMIAVNLVNTVSFFCPNGCMMIGPIVHALATQDELDKEYAAAKKA